MYYTYRTLKGPFCRLISNSNQILLEGIRKRHLTTSREPKREPVAIDVEIAHRRLGHHQRQEAVSSTRMLWLSERETAYAPSTEGEVNRTLCYYKWEEICYVYPR